MPCRMTVVVWSGISNMRTILATVPMGYKSSNSGRSTSARVWHTAPMMRPLLYALSIRRRDDLRPTATGSTTPGNNTMLRKGRIGRHLPIVPSNNCSSLPSKSAIRENALPCSFVSSSSLNLLLVMFLVCQVEYIPYIIGAKWLQIYIDFIEKESTSG